jgi:hypothetical protein
MPLLDHLHPPLSERRPWESFHTTWAAALADSLNDVLPPGFIALETVHAGAAVELDVSTFAEPGVAPVVLPGTFPEGCTIEIVSTEGGRTLVAAIELVSPRNKDRAGKRRLFAARCATYLARGIGLVILDVVTSRQANLHHELLDLLDLGSITQARLLPEQTIYAVAYRPLRRNGAEQIDVWPMPLRLGEPLPTVPLSLAAELCIPVDLETGYQTACQRRRFDEALG